MKLTLIDSSAEPIQIEAGGAAAEALIKSRGFSLEDAYDAVMKRTERRQYNRAAAKAWDDAEDEAIRVCYGDEDDSDDAVLAPTKEG